MIAKYLALLFFLCQTPEIISQLLTRVISFQIYTIMQIIFASEFSKNKLWNLVKCN